MRGRKHQPQLEYEDTEHGIIKKESPNEGTETYPSSYRSGHRSLVIKKESPNEGTETVIVVLIIKIRIISDKKRIPE